MQAVKRPRGRPKGSKNKAKATTKPKGKRGRPKGSKNKTKPAPVMPIEVPRDIPDDTRIDEDAYLGDDLHLNADPNEHDLQDELSLMEGFSQYADEARGNGLTWGDY